MGRRAVAFPLEGKLVVVYDEPALLTGRPLEALMAVAAPGYRCNLSERVAEKLHVPSARTAEGYLAEARQFLGTTDTFSAVCRALGGGSFKLANVDGSRFFGDMFGVLTDRRKEILSCFYKQAIDDGCLDYSKLAPKLFVAESTLYAHVLLMHHKLSEVSPVHNQAQLAAVAYYVHSRSPGLAVLESVKPGKPLNP